MTDIEQVSTDRFEGFSMGSNHTDTDDSKADIMFGGRVVGVLRPGYHGDASVTITEPEVRPAFLAMANRLVGLPADTMASTQGVIADENVEDLFIHMKVARRLNAHRHTAYILEEDGDFWDILNGRGGKYYAGSALLSFEEEVARLKADPWFAGNGNHPRVWVKERNDFVPATEL